MHVTQGQTGMIKEDELFDEVGNIVEEFKEKSKNLRLETKKSIKQITREYKEQLKIALSTLDEEPSDQANLNKPTEIFETLADKQNSIKLEQSEKQSELENEFKEEILDVISTDFISNEQPIRIIPPINWNNGIIPVIEFDPITGEEVNFMWINNINNWVPYSNSKFIKFDPRTHRIDGSIGVNKNKIVPYTILSHGNGSVTSIGMGKNRAQDLLWKEMIDYLRPFRSKK